MPTTQAIQTLNEPIEKRTISHIVTQKYTTPSHSRALAEKLLTQTGKELNYGQMRKHPKFQETRNKYFSNKIGRLRQGVVTRINDIGKRVEGTNTFYVIKFEDIRKDRLNEIYYTSVVCEVRPDKKDPNQTRITICGTNVYYPGDVGTNTASLELFKLTINSILSISAAKYACFDIEFFYLSTPLDRPEYVKVQLSKITQEFITEYNLTSLMHKGWIYFGIHRGCYVLPQYGMLANKQLRLR